MGVEGEGIAGELLTASQLAAQAAPNGRVFSFSFLSRAARSTAGSATSCAASCQLASRHLARTRSVLDSGFRKFLLLFVRFSWAAQRESWWAWRTEAMQRAVHSNW